MGSKPYKISKISLISVPEGVRFFISRIMAVEGTKVNPDIISPALCRLSINCIKIFIFSFKI
jgi:hypothetical protein